MEPTTKIIIGAAGGKLITQLGKTGNRHGLIAGATGTGKTISLQILAEGYSRIGVPVITADIKGDLSGLGMPGKEHPKIRERLNIIPVKDFAFRAYPVAFWDIFTTTGLPVRTTISEMGPLLLSTLLELNDTQTGILFACFRIADDDGLLLLDL
jgi:DNA helicase HerA-like ATPase